MMRTLANVELFLVRAAYNHYQIQSRFAHFFYGSFLRPAAE